MCFNPCKKYKKKIKNLRSAVKRYDSALNESYKKCEEKDKQIREWKRKYEQARSNQKPPYCRVKQCPFNPNNSGKKKLEVKGQNILYGRQKKRLCGVSRWEALWRATGAFGFEHDWGDYSLEWYEQKLKQSRINYVRHGGIKNTQFLYDHCKRMKDAGIIVEVTVYRAGSNQEDILVNLNDMDHIAELGNVFFDINNEFSGQISSVDKVISIAKNLKNQGCLISGGAWTSILGRNQSDLFHAKYPDIDIITHHRNWDTNSFERDKRYEKPIVWNEYFAFKENLPLEQVKILMNTAFHCEYSGVQYYGFRNSDMFPGLKNDDPFHWRLILNYTGDLAQ